jgi:GTPase SAR1 family protein
MPWWEKYKKNYSWLRSVRGSLYDKILTLWSRVFVNKEYLPSWREKYQWTIIDIDQQEVTRSMMENYMFDAEGLIFLSEICRQHGLKNPGIVLLPITADYVALHNREFPAMTYPMIRNRLREMCRALGITLIDLGDPLVNRDLFRDLFHLNPRGAQYITGLLSQKLSPVIHAKR